MIVAMRRQALCKAMRWIRVFGTALTACLLAVSAARASSPFIVYFEPGSVRLDARAEAILDFAASAILAEETRLVEVTGAADRLGSSADNLRLSLRRAEAVKRYLVSRGVPARIIGVTGLGEEQPLIDTADGVAEKYNRRAHVVLVLKDGRRLP